MLPQSQHTYIIIVYIQSTNQRTQENGIFDAIEKNVLEAIQLTVVVDKDSPTNVLESYTFSFKYSGTPNGVNRRLESLSIHPVGCVADVRSVRSARMDLEMIVRRLITMSAFLPVLPSNDTPSLSLHFL